MEDKKERLKGSSVLEEEHVDMHQVVPQPMYLTIAEQEDSNEENFWDELEMFCSSLDIKQSTPSLDNHEFSSRK